MIADAHIFVYAIAVGVYLSIVFITMLISIYDMTLLTPKSIDLIYYIRTSPLEQLQEVEKKLKRSRKLMKAVSILRAINQFISCCIIGGLAGELYAHYFFVK